MNFGKVNRSVAFNPTSAFPLDARSYFESYDEAMRAAATAEAVGSTNTQYYFGQTIVVVENNKASSYTIQPTKQLSPIVENIPIDENLFEYDENGNLTIIGATAAPAGSHLAIGENGVLTWVTPIDSYSKNEVYNKEETESLIVEKVASAAHLKRKIVPSIDAIVVDAIDADQYIYMVPIIEGFVDNEYDEYMVIDGAIEKVGSWEVDLSDYAKKTDLDNKVDKIENARLMTEAEGEKLASIKDLIKKLNGNDFTLDENGQLNLNPIPTTKVTGLEDILNNKVDKKEGWTLLSPTDQEKLSQLVIGDNGSVEISGKVNAENVQGLEDWISARAGSLPGLSEKNFSSALENKLNGIEDGAEKNYISSVEETQLEVVNKKLSIVSIDSNKVNGLSELLNNKANVSSVNEVKTKVTNLELALNNYQVTIDNRLDALEDALVWKPIS